MHELAEQLLKTIRKQGALRAGDRVAVAVSGGADSVALLYLLMELRAELGVVISVAHVNHKLRGSESDEDERFVRRLASASGLELHVCDAPVDGSGKGVEAKARDLRYEFFRGLARDQRVSKIATAHTLDDQAETVLLRMFRGTGIRGLTGVHPRIALEEGGHWFGEVVRPLLGLRHVALVKFLEKQGQNWREDSSNKDLTFLRNRVRHRLLPIIAEEFGESAIEHMGELAEIARAEEEQWTEGAERPGLEHSGAALNVEQLSSLRLATQRRVVRAWVEANAPGASISFRLIEDVLDLAGGTIGKELTLPGRMPHPHPNAKYARPYLIRRARHELVLDADIGDARDYEYSLSVPGEVLIRELGIRIEARLADAETLSEQERELGVLDPAHVGKNIVIRNWRPGDRFWPVHTKEEKKVKELLGERHATGVEKQMWPVAMNEVGALLWVRGFPGPVSLRARAGKAVCIREVASR